MRLSPRPLEYPMSSFRGYSCLPGLLLGAIAGEPSQVRRVAASEEILVPRGGRPCFNPPSTGDSDARTSPILRALQCGAAGQFDAGAHLQF